MSEKFKTLSAAMLLLSRINDKGEEEILLQKRKNTGWMDGYWDFSASGHVEENEPMKMTAIREAKEELGIEVKIEDVEFMSMLHTYTPNTGQIYYNGHFKIAKWKDEPSVNEPNKCEEIRWFKIQNLPENIIESRKLAIENYQNHIPYDEYGWNKMGGQK